MKKTLLILFLVSLQANAFEKIRLGPSLGLTAPFVESSGQGSSLDVFDFSIGLGTGGTVEAVFNDKISFLLDLNHVTYYSEFYYTDSPATIGEAVFRYIFIKPAVMFKPNETFGVFAGIGYGFNISAEAEYNGTITDYNDSISYEANNRLSLDLGIAFTIDANSFFIRPRLAYQVGLKPILESTTTDYEVKFNALMLNVDLLFDIN